MTSTRTTGYWPLVLAVCLIVPLALFWRWQVPGSAMASGEVDACLQRLRTALPVPPERTAALLANLDKWAATDDGRPVYMLNLMRFHQQAPQISGHPEFRGSAFEANALYENAVMPLLLRQGGYPVFIGSGRDAERSAHRPTALLAQGTAPEGWDSVLLVRYPNRRAFFNLVCDPAYLGVAAYKLEAVDLALVPLEKAAVLPELHQVAALLAAVALLVVLGVWLFRRQ